MDSGFHRGMHALHWGAEDPRTERPFQPKRLRTFRRRGGVATMELLLNLPIWLIMLVAAIEIGEVFSGAQHVCLASRIGVAVASRIEPLAPEGVVPSTVVDAVESHLRDSGMCCTKVILEHNSAGRAAVLISGEGPGDRPGRQPPSLGTYVRVTVYAQRAGLAAGVLRGLGVPWPAKVLAESTTYPYAFPSRS